MESLISRSHATHFYLSKKISMIIWINFSPSLASSLSEKKMDKVIWQEGLFVHQQSHSSSSFIKRKGCNCGTDEDITRLGDDSIEYISGSDVMHFFSFSLVLF